MTRAFSKVVKAKAFARAGGRCQHCDAKLLPGQWHADHIVPHGLGGAGDLDNCCCLCIGCHRVKTGSRDIPAMAKVKRIRAKLQGLKKPKSPIPGSRSTRWKKKLNGRTERR